MYWRHSIGISEDRDAVQAKTSLARLTGTWNFGTLNCFDIQHIYHILQVWGLGQDVWISCPCKKKLGLTPPKINCRYYQECLLFNVQWCFCSAVTCTPVQKGVPEQIQQKCSQYFSLYLIGISLISGSSKGPTLVAVFTKLLKICAYSLKYRFALVLMFFSPKKTVKSKGNLCPIFVFCKKPIWGSAVQSFYHYLPINVCPSIIWTSNTVSGVYIRTNVDQFLQYARGLTEVTL